MFSIVHLTSKGPAGADGPPGKEGVIGERVRSDTFTIKTIQFCNFCILYEGLSQSLIIRT